MNNILTLVKFNSINYFIAYLVNEMEDYMRKTGRRLTSRDLQAIERKKQLLDSAEKLFAKQNYSRGMNLKEALVKAGRTCLRPIIMTTLAMIFGMICTGCLYIFK